MSETMIATLIGSGVTLTITIVTLFINALIEKYKCRLAIQQKKYEVKRERLNGIYEKLILLISISTHHRTIFCSMLNMLQIIQWNHLMLF